MHWYEDKGPTRHMPALDVPADKVIDTNGAGDVFHGAYVHHHLAAPEAGWEEHFRFARAASTHAIQHLGNEASMPREEDVAKAMEEWREKPMTVTV